MSRIPAIDLATVGAKAKPLPGAVHKVFGVTPNLFHLAAHSPAAPEGLLGLNGALGHGSFNGKVREAIWLSVAQANQCDYCLSAHTALDKGAGLSDADVSLARKENSTDPRTAAIMRFARSLVGTRGHATDSDLGPLRQAGVTDAEIVETLANRVINIFTKYLNHVAGTDIDFPVVHAAMIHAA